MRRIVIVSCLVAGLAAADLVPASWPNTNDQLGFRWDLQQGGGIADGTNDLVDGANYIRIHTGGSTPTTQQDIWQQYNNAYNFNQGTVARDPDNGDLVSSSSWGDLVITRRQRLYQAEGYLRNIELIENTGASDVEVTLFVFFNLGVSARSASTETGSNFNAQQVHRLGEDERGLVVTQSNRPDMLWMLGRTGDEAGNMRLYYQNDQLYFAFRLRVPAGQRVGVVHVLGQRASGTGIGPAFLDPLLESSFYRDLPRDVRRDLVNAPMRLGDSAGTATIDELGLDREDDVDLLALGEEGFLRGVLAWQQATLSGPYGSVSIDLDEVAAVTGRLFHPRRQRVYLRDGEVLIGRLEIAGLSFRHRSGFDLLGEGEDPALDRVVRAGLPDEGPWPEGWAISLADRSRLRIAPPNDAELAVATAWGPLRLGLDRVWQLSRSDEESGVWQLITTDGSRLAVTPLSPALALETRRFGARELALSAITRLDAPGALGGEAPEPGAGAEGAAVLTLADGSVVVGAVATPQLGLGVEGHRISLPLDQIEIAVRDDDGRFAIRLWDGSRLVGDWLDEAIELGLGDGLRIPGDDVTRIAMPRPGLDPADRARILELVRQLGDPDWRRREEAQEELAAFGEPALPMLETARNDADDPEIRHRLDLLLADDEAPVGGDLPF